MYRLSVCQTIVSFLLLAFATTAYGGLTSFSVSETTSNEDVLFNGPAEVKRAYLKYGIEPPSRVVARAMITGVVTATPEASDTDYLIPVAIGSPSNVYTMNLDTGSSSFLVSASKLGSSGTVTTPVTIGGVTVTRQAVSLATPGGFSGNSNNIVGMAPVVGTFYVNAINQGTIAPVFTANLKKGAPGTYRFGGISTADYKGSITYVTGDASKGFWEFSGNGYAIGSGTFQSLTIDGVVDTGTTLLFLPQSIVKAYYGQVKGAAYDNTQGGYTFPCSATLPDLILGISTYKATVPGSYMNFAPTSTGSTTCFGGLQSDSGIGFSIFGLIFIKSQFVVFKGTAATSISLGFAVKAA